MVEVFLFRCNGCGRVAPHQFWRPRTGKKGSAPEVMMQYPSPECPQCNGISIDVNHGYAEGAAGDALLKEYRQKLLAKASDANHPP
jgi:hypothetical protein